jgi:tRNA (guanine-N7-)-methyltransferase
MARSSNPFQAARRPPILFRPGHAPLVGDIEGQTYLLDVEFGRHAPLLFEIGSGRGDFLLETARTRPDWNLLGLEMSRPRSEGISRKAERLQLGNVLVLNAVAELALTELLPSGSASEIHVHFPDPWPKKRHHKRRLLAPAVVPGLVRVLAPGGLICVMTDHAEYAADALAALDATSELTNVAGQGRYSERPDEPLTYYQELSLAQGSTVHYIRMRRRDDSRAIDLPKP